jgi:hypothetical protein
LAIGTGVGGDVLVGDAGAMALLGALVGMYVGQEL